MAVLNFIVEGLLLLCVGGWEGGVSVWWRFKMLSPIFEWFWFLVPLLMHLFYWFCYSYVWLCSYLLLYGFSTAFLHWLCPSPVGGHGPADLICSFGWIEVNGLSESAFTFYCWTFVSACGPVFKFKSDAGVLVLWRLRWLCGWKMDFNSTYSIQHCVSCLFHLFTLFIFRFFIYAIRWI